VHTPCIGIAEKKDREQGIDEQHIGVHPTRCLCCSLLVLRHARRADEDHIAVSPHVLRQTGLRQRAATTGVHDTREASGHQRDRDLSHDVTPDPQTRAEAMDVVAGAASPLLSASDKHA